MPENVVILCNGSFPKKEYPRYLLRTADFVICCDGALKKFLRYRETVCPEREFPDLIIGDMDSLPSRLRQRYEGRVIEVSEQDTNDQTKAFRWVMDNLKDVSTIHILGATGEREDHTIGNISLLMEYARTYNLDAKGIRLEMVSDFSTIFAATDSFEMECGTGRKVSIFSPDNSLRIKSTGLEWKTDDVIFDNWWKATLNRASEDKVRLEFSKKSIAVVIMD